MTDYNTYVPNFLTNDTAAKAGGVWYDKTMATASYDKESETYLLNMNNGATIEYKEQDPRLGASIFLETSSNHYNGKDNLVVSMLQGAKVTGSANEDRIHMNRCLDCSVDVANDDLADDVYMDSHTALQHLDSPDWWETKNEDGSYLLSGGNSAQYKKDDSIDGDDSYAKHNWIQKLFNLTGTYTQKNKSVGFKNNN